MIYHSVIANINILNIYFCLKKIIAYCRLYHICLPTYYLPTQNIQGKQLFDFVRQLVKLVYLSFSVAKPARSLSCPFIFIFN